MHTIVLHNNTHTQNITYRSRGKIPCVFKDIFDGFPEATEMVVMIITEIVGDSYCSEVFPSIALSNLFIATNCNICILSLFNYIVQNHVHVINRL